MSLRERLLAAALASEGLDAFSTPEQFRALVAPGETDRRAAEIMTKSTCALAVRGHWREGGIVHPRLFPPYREQKAVEDLVVIARACGAYIEGPAVRRYEPVPGDVVIVAPPEHVYTIAVADLTADGAWDVESIDGGQLSHGDTALDIGGGNLIYVEGPSDDARYQCIRRVERRLVRGRDTRKDVKVTRDVVGVIDIDKLVALATAA